MLSFNHVFDEFTNSELELMFDSDSDNENRSLFDSETDEDGGNNIHNNNQDCDDKTTSVTNFLQPINLELSTSLSTTNIVSSDQSGSYSFDSLVPISNSITLHLPSVKISNNPTTPLENLSTGNSNNNNKYNSSNCFTSDPLFGYDNEMFYKTSTPEPHFTLQPEECGSSSSLLLSDTTLNNSSNSSFEKVSLEQVTNLLFTDQQQSNNKEEIMLTLNEVLNITNSELLESSCSSNDFFPSLNSNTTTNISKESFKITTKKRSLSTQDTCRVFKKPKAFQCSNCLKMFQSPAHVKRHKTSVHSNERNYPCTICEKQFKRKDHLHSHQLKIHQID